MTSSAQDVSHQNLETASTIRADTVTGAHLLKVVGYSLTKGIGIGKFICSDVFMIDGYDWVIQYYPDGKTQENSSFISFISFYLKLKSNATDVKVQVTFTMLQQNGLPSDMSGTTGITLKSTTGTSSSSWGYNKFTKRAKLEASQCLKDDAFTLKCTITIVKGTKLEVISPYRVAVPPSNLSRNWADLLENGKGADVTFVVKGERFNAHCGVLAARSDVFNAMFLGGMKEKGTNDITIDDIEVPIFKSMLYFIYSDTVPDFVTKDDNKMNQSSLVAQHLLVAADRYGLERLKLMCEDRLSKTLDVDMVGTILILAERHNCCQLKAECLKFVSSPEVFKELALTPGFHNLVKVCPSIVKDIRALHLK